eukprot:gene14588-22314_t
METEKLHEALQCTFVSAVAQQRQEAEAFVLQASKQPGGAKAFYEIAAAAQVNVGIRQAAAIRLRQIIAEHDDWNHVKSAVTPEEKQFLKTTALQVVATAPGGVRKQMLEVIRMMIRYDFPDQWPNLGKEIKEYLESNEPAKMSAGLFALRKLVKRYESMVGERRSEVQQMASYFFPLLAKLFAHVNQQSPEQTETVADFQKVLLKIFYSCNSAKAVPFIRDDPENLAAWMTAILHVIRQPVDAPSSANPNSSAWRAKKWAGYVVVVLMKRYSRAGTASKDYKQFQQVWVTKYAPQLVSACVQFLVSIREAADRNPGMELPGKTVCRFIEVVTAALGSKKLYAGLLPVLDAFVCSTVFPFACFSDADIELWSSNPQEYVRKKHCVMMMEQDFANPTFFSINFIAELCKAPAAFHDKGVPMRFLQFLQKVLEETKDPNDLALNKRRYGAFTCIGALKNVAGIREHFETVAPAHVFPMYSSPFGFMRLSAVWLISRFGSMEWKTAGNLETAVRANISLMKDPELPVRVESGMALQKLMPNKGAAPVVKGALHEIVTTVFGLMNEIDVEELVSTIEVVIALFGPDLVQESVSLTTTLIQHFFKITAGGVEDMDTIAAGEGCISALCALVQALDDKPDASIALQTACLPLLERLFTDSYSIFFEESVKLVSLLASCTSRTFSPAFWNVFDVLYAVFTKEAKDTAHDALVPFDNFISNDPVGFLTDMERPRKLKALCHMLLTEDYQENEQNTAPLLIDTMLQHCKEHHERLDQMVPEFFDVVLGRLTGRKARVPLKILLCNNILTGFWYNTPLTLQYLESRGATAAFFDGCFALTPKYVRLSDLKTLVLGFTSLLEFRLASGGAFPVYFTADVVKKMTDLCLACVINRHHAAVAIEKEYEDLEAESSEESEPPIGLGGDYESDGDDIAGGEDDDAALAELFRQ